MFLNLRLKLNKSRLNTMYLDCGNMMSGIPTIIVEVVKEIACILPPTLKDDVEVVKLSSNLWGNRTL